MVGSARASMRHPLFQNIPSWAPMSWVLENKLRIIMGRRIDFNHYVDYSNVYPEPLIFQREYHSTPRPGERKVQRKDEKHYIHPGNFDNR
jgi:hypothetical protein